AAIQSPALHDIRDRRERRACVRFLHSVDHFVADAAHEYTAHPQAARDAPRTCARDPRRARGALRVLGCWIRSCRDAEKPRSREAVLIRAIPTSGAQTRRPYFHPAPLPILEHAVSRLTPY